MTVRADLPQPVENTADVETPVAVNDTSLPDGYEDIRSNSDIQFSPVDLEEIKPHEPSWFEEALTDFFRWLGDLLSPIGQALAGVWPVVIGILAAFVLYLVWKLVGPMLDKQATGKTRLPEAEPEWQPDREESLALLEDADRLAAEGRYEEAVRLLLQRSVGQIAAARPDWVDPSSTARELAALPSLSDAARRTFAVISEAVERSLWALRSLSREDWETARAAYADFALARIEGAQSA